MVELGGFELGRVHCCDCLEAMKRLPDKCVDLVLTDPPYGNDNNYDDLQARWEPALGGGLVSSKHGIAPRPIANDGKEHRYIFRGMVEQSARIIKQGGVFVTCCGGGGGAKGLQFVDWSMIVDELLTFKAAVVWDKGKSAWAGTIAVLTKCFSLQCKVILANGGMRPCKLRTL